MANVLSARTTGEQGRRSERVRRGAGIPVTGPAALTKGDKVGALARVQGRQDGIDALGVHFAIVAADGVLVAEDEAQVRLGAAPGGGG